MTGRWKRTGGKQRIGSAFKRSWRAAPLAALAILASGVFASTASAELVKSELVKEVTDTVGSTVKAVGAGVNDIPLPSTTAPVKPSTSPQAVTPAPPPKPVAKPPSRESTPSPSRAEAGSGVERGSADPPPVDSVAGAARGMADSVINTDGEAANQVAGAERSDGAPAAAARPGETAGAGEAVVRERRTGSNPPLAVRAADVAALQRWLARVWPAVALGGGGIDGAGIVDAMAEEVLRPALAVVGGLLLASSPVLPVNGDSRLTGDPVGPNANPPRPDPVPFTTVDDGVKVVYLIVIAALLALLVFTVWREFRIALHPGLR